MTADPALREALARVLHGQFAAFFDRDVCAEAADAILSSGLVVGAGGRSEGPAWRLLRNYEEIEANDQVPRPSAALTAALTDGESNG